MSKTFNIKLNEEIKQFFHIQNLQKITKEKIIFNFQLYYHDNIRAMVWKVIRMIGPHNFDYHEVYNKVLEQSIDSIQNFWNKNEKNIKFTLFFWTDIKLKTLNFFNSIKNTQFIFERKLAELELKKHFVKNIFETNYKTNNTKQQLKDLLDSFKEKLETKLNKSEITFLESLIDNKTIKQFTTNKRNQMIEKIRDKLFC